METLDNPNQSVDESTVPFLPTALRIGVIGGLVSITFTLVLNLTGMSIPTSIMSGILMGAIGIAITIFIGYYAIKQHRDEDLGGYISLGRAFLVGFIAIFLASLLNNLFSILYMTTIDPGYVDQVIGATEEMMSKMGAPESTIEQQLEQMRNNFTPAGMLKNGLLWGGVITAIIALIQAAIMKKQSPSA
ncbi:MAG: DUF4199 domain-containing protein [Bacteroidetes bacterium]|nr:MAG: DUF4199 domain-containing protein [Bacteroidota bacterium]